MHRCLKIAIKPSREIRWLCFNAGKLFNCANYLIKTGSAKPNIYDLYNKLSSNFFKLNLHSQTTLKIFSHVVRGWLNFFDYLKNPHKYPHPVNPPKFKNKKNCFHIVSFPRKYVKIDGSTISLCYPKSCYPKSHKIGKGRRKRSDLNFININTNLDLSQLHISEVNIVPKYGEFFELQIIYKKKKRKEREREDEKEEKGINAIITNYGNDVSNNNDNNKREEGKLIFRRSRRMALDPGVSNFFSVVIEGVKKGFLIDGKIWKSLTTFRLKTISELKSRLDGILNKAKKMAQESLILLLKEYTPERRISRGLYKSSFGILNADINAARNIGGIRGDEGLKEVERIYLYQKRKSNKGIVEREGEESESKRKGSPVERVEAVAVAGGSKVCMSQELIANKPSPNPLLKAMGC